MLLVLVLLVGWGGFLARRTVSPNEITVLTRPRFPSRPEAVPCAAVEWVEVMDADWQEPIAVRGDGKTLEFGHHLPEAEKEWIRDLLVREIVGERRERRLGDAL